MTTEQKTIECTGIELDHELNTAQADGWRLAALSVEGGGAFEVQLVRDVEVRATATDLS